MALKWTSENWKKNSRTHADIANDIENHIANLDDEYDKLKNILSSQEETLRREIDCVV